MDRVYKSVNSKEMRDKALRLGLHVSDHFDLQQPFIVIEFDKNHCWSTSKYNEVCFPSYVKIEEITQQEFLKLEEPILDGDYVLIQDERGKRIGKVTWIEEDQCEVNDIKECILVSSCKKLTEGQINAVGLRD